MLVLGVKEGDYIVIGEDVKIKVIKTGNLFRLGVEAPKGMRVLRQRVYERETEGTHTETTDPAEPEPSEGGPPGP
jgi:carbon storage regulator